MRRRAQDERRISSLAMGEIGRLFGPEIQRQSSTYRSQNIRTGLLPAPLLNEVQRNWWLRGFGNSRHALSEFSFWYGMNPSIYMRSRPEPFIPFRESA